MSKTGSCLCGAVTYRLHSDVSHAGACHCKMCRQWTGGINIAMHVAPGGISFDGEDNITKFTSSDWAERAFCKTCGSSLYYHVTAPGPHQGDYHVCIGTLDDADDVPVTEEIFIDVKPKGYALAGDMKQMTGEEVFALFAASND